MNIHTKVLGDRVVVLKLEGKLNMVSAPKVRDEIHATVTAGNNKVTVDLTEVDFIDSSGLGALINGLKAA